MSTCGDHATCVVLLLLFHITCPLAETQATCVVLLLRVHLRRLRPLAWYYCHLSTCGDSGHLRGIIDTCPLAETHPTCIVLLLLFHLLLVHWRRLRPLAWYYCYLSTCGDAGHLRGIIDTCPLAGTQATCVVLLLLFYLLLVHLAETQDTCVVLLLLVHLRRLGPLAWCH